MLDIIFERPESGDASGVVCKVKTEKDVEPDIVSSYISVNVSINDSLGYGSIFTSYTKCLGGFVIRKTSPINIPFGNRNHVKLYGNYNYDGIEIISSISSRVEIRNEYGVLIADNGMPWLDGTYPPDAKNRAGLAGLHAAPAVINPELETALTGDLTNKERVQE